MIGALIMIGSAVVSLGAQAYSGYSQSKANDRARKEARDLAARDRADFLEQQSINNKFARQELKMRDNQLSFNKKMFDEYTKDKEEEKSYLYNTASNSLLTAGANKINPPIEDTLARKSMYKQRYF